MKSMKKWLQLGQAHRKPRISLSRKTKQERTHQIGYHNDCIKLNFNKCIIMIINNIQFTTIFVFINLYYSLNKITIQYIFYIKNVTQSNMHRLKIRTESSQRNRVREGYNKRPSTLHTSYSVVSKIYSWCKQKEIHKSFQCKCHHTEDFKGRLNPVKQKTNSVSANNIKIKQALDYIGQQLQDMC